MSENAYQYFVGRQNARIVQLLERNREIAATVQAVLEQTVEFCDHRGLDFDKLKVRDATISQEGKVSFQLGR